jgi:3-hydroxy-9,10-secoandrosta-1,3,5(10)-triene-9,17-dione monooxygenase reductase component
MPGMQQSAPRPGVPRNPGAAVPEHDRRAFRNALGAFVTGVTILTTCDADGTPAGLTANSFNSVSLDPPLVLWSLALDSTNLEAFRQAEWWAVHVLAAGQEDLSNRFARKDSDKFSGLHTTSGPGGIPLLPEFAARFICRAAFEYEGGDHAIFIGAVDSFEQAGRPPLIYHQGRYGGVFPASPSAADTQMAHRLSDLERRGLAETRDGASHLTRDGREVTLGLLALAESGVGNLSDHERSALRHLIGRIAS